MVKSEVWKITPYHDIPQSWHRQRKTMQQPFPYQHRFAAAAFAAEKDFGRAFAAQDARREALEDLALHAGVRVEKDGPVHQEGIG